MGTPNDNVKRDILPIPDPKPVGLTTYDAKDPNTKPSHYAGGALQYSDGAAVTIDRWRLRLLAGSTPSCDLATAAIEC
jgi:hypothetical protein